MSDPAFAPRASAPGASAPGASAPGASATRRIGLRPRPSVDPTVVALLSEAVLELWPRPSDGAAAEAARAERAERAARAWRFSGRWWARPAALRRDRPWVT